MCDAVCIRIAGYTLMNIATRMLSIYNYTYEYIMVEHVIALNKTTYRQVRENTQICLVIVVGSVVCMSITLNVILLVGTTYSQPLYFYYIVRAACVSYICHILIKLYSHIDDYNSTHFTILLI